MRGEQPLAALARRFRRSEDSLARHRANHLVKAVVPLPEPKPVHRDVAGDGDLVEQVQDLQRKTLEILKDSHFFRFRLRGLLLSKMSKTGTKQAIGSRTSLRKVTLISKGF